MWASLTPGAFSRTAETVNSSVSSESMNVVISAFLEPRPESVAVRLSSFSVGGQEDAEKVAGPWFEIVFGVVPALGGAAQRFVIGLSAVVDQLLD